MVRFTPNPSYGATGSFPPPPYSGFFRPNGPSEPDDWSPVDPPGSTRMFEKVARISRSRLFLTFLTFIVTVGLCMTMMPVTYCNDPADPQVRERIRGEWNKELLEHEKQAAEREVVKGRWVLEDERHGRLVRKWEQERVEHDRELKERARREEMERKQLNLFWNRVETHQCKTYGTREYTAVLMNLPMDWGRRLEACRATSLEIHGIPRLPTNCEDRGRDVIVGRWEIDQYEPDCNPHWGWYKNKGCTSRGSGKRRIEHFLENLPKGGDWREFCATTPVRFHEMEFAGAQECFQYNGGTYGLWEIDDADC